MQTASETVQTGKVSCCLLVGYSVFLLPDRRRNCLALELQIKQCVAHCKRALKAKLLLNVLVKEL